VLKNEANLEIYTTIIKKIKIRTCEILTKRKLNFNYWVAVARVSQVSGFVQFASEPKESKFSLKFLENNEFKLLNTTGLLVKFILLLILTPGETYRQGRPE